LPTSEEVVTETPLPLTESTDKAEMEFLTIFLSSLLGILSPAGLVVDRVVENAIRSQLDSAETLAVRIDNAPSYQVLQGKAERVRIAGRGVFPRPAIRIAAVDVETDPIAINPSSLGGKLKLDKPLQAGVRLVIDRQDINRALQSPAIAQKLRSLSLDFLGGSAGQLQRYDFVNPQVEFLGNNRLRFQVSLKEQRSDNQVSIVAESGVAIASGRQLQLIEPTVRINDEALPSQLVSLLVGGVSQRLDLANLENSGITARVLNLEMNQDELTLAAFVRIDPRFLASVK
jgi:hypothetical protein